MKVDTTDKEKKKDQKKETEGNLEATKTNSSDSRIKGIKKGSKIEVFCLVSGLLVCIEQLAKTSQCVGHGECRRE